MRFEFADSELRDLYAESSDARKLPAAVIRRFFIVVQAIEGATNERDFYELKSLHFEALKGKRAKQGHRSMRLNDQYRLIVTLEDRPDGRVVVIRGIEDYH